MRNRDASFIFLWDFSRQTIVDTNNQRAVVTALFVVDSLTIASVIAFALAGQFALAMALFFLFTTARGPSLSLEHIWINQHLDSSTRATMFSLRGQVNAIAQIVGGPLLGMIASGVSTRIALVVAGIILAPTLFLYTHNMRNGKLHIPSSEETP